MQICESLLFLKDTIPYIDQVCLSDNDVQQMNWKSSER